MMKFLLMTFLSGVSLSAFAEEKIYVCGQDVVCEGLSEGDERETRVYDSKTGELVSGIVQQYYGNGQLQNEVNCNEGKVDGLWKWYYETGKLKGEGNYKEGKADGKGKVYYENGKISAEMEFKNGKEDGLFKVYYENGQLKEYGIWKEGVNLILTKEKIYFCGQDILCEKNKTIDAKTYQPITGIIYNQIYNGIAFETVIAKVKEGMYNGLYKVYTKDGKPYYEVTYKQGKKDGPYKEYGLQDSQIKTEGSYKNDKEEGPWKWYNYLTGILEMEENYKEGVLNGMYTTYYKNGQINTQKYFKDGEVDGVDRWYYESGQLHAEINYKDGNREGLSKNYYENGQLKTEFSYINNVLNGSLKEYYENGQVKFDEIYNNGKKVSGEYYDEKGNLLRSTIND